MRGGELDQLPPTAQAQVSWEGSPTVPYSTGRKDPVAAAPISPSPGKGNHSPPLPTPSRALAGSPVPEPCSTPAAEVRSSRTHSWFSILCISSLILMAVVSSSSSSSGFREASLSDSEVSSSLTCFRSRFRPTEAGTLTGDKCRDYRNEAGSKVGSR